jgi:hypothetical protein
MTLYHRTARCLAKWSSASASGHVPLALRPHLLALLQQATVAPRASSNHFRTIQIDCGSRRGVEPRKRMIDTHRTVSGRFRDLHDVSVFCVFCLLA